MHVGVKVKFHACLINDKSKICYLATSVWLEANKNVEGTVNIKPIKKHEINATKIDIYNNVVNSVADSIKDIVVSNVYATPQQIVSQQLQQPPQQQQYATPQQIVSQQLQQPPQQQPTIISKAPMIYDDKIALGFIKPWEHAVIKSNIYDKGW